MLEQLKARFFPLRPHAGLRQFVENTLQNFASFLLPGAPATSKVIFR
jgi:hypothetical protein